MSKIKKIKIKNLFGIVEYEGDGKNIELVGTNGVGKSSVVDAIRYALTNKSDRKYIVRKGETEGEILIETDSGLFINRKARIGQTDYKSVKQNGFEVGSPETFLREIFSPLQLSPVEFMEKSEKEQNAILLNMIQYDWNLSNIKDWFGEIPDWVSYDQNILQVLNDIQSEQGDYFQKRQEVNRDIRNKMAFINEIAMEIPVGYESERWESENLGELYQKIEVIRRTNEQIEKARYLIEQKDNKTRSFEADKEIRISALEKEFAAERESLVRSIEKMNASIKEYQTKLDGLDEKKNDKIQVILKDYEANISKYDNTLEQYREIASQEIMDYTELQQQAEFTEKMKSYLNEYKRMKSLEEEVKQLKVVSNDFTKKIEKARALPGEILETATIPIKGLSVEGGIPLIHGLPISNLSDGEKLDLCIDVAIENPNALQIVLIDGIEKMSTKMRSELYEKCKSKGLQFIATRTTDDDELTVIEL